MRAPQVVVGDFGVQLVLVRDAFIWFGVQIQDGDGICETRLLQIQLLSENKASECKMIANVEEVQTAGDFKERKQTYSSSSSSGANVIMTEQSLAVIATLY